ncbi:MAG: phosphomethylpyrimidine synthase ThiC [bacterium]|nr:phosphomethylpyrimidine synthase ThiC [bacterium]
MTQIEKVKKGIISEEIKQVALAEDVEIVALCKLVAESKVVIPYNSKRKKKIKNLCGIGKNLRTKVNANIGTSSDCIRINNEIKKIEIATRYGADAIMDLSTGGDLDEIRKRIIDNCTLPLGTVPIYQAMVEEFKESGDVQNLDIKRILKVIRKQADDGVDFMTIHAGVTKETIRSLEIQKRILDVVSRGGAFLLSWIRYHQKENPFYQDFDEILDIAEEYDITLSLGDGLRPGCLYDATDQAQIKELIVLGELAQRALERNISVMIEGPGHMPMNQIKANVILEKELCREVPFYCLGPLVTDIAPGYDHITAAIGGAIAASSGADFLCYVTPSEHLSIPDIEDVKEGVIALKIAAHAADISKNIGKALDKDIAMSKARKELNWETQINLAIDPQKARKYRDKLSVKDEKTCSMCGEFCAINMVKESVKVR